jgi:hypothetical protein
MSRISAPTGCIALLQFLDTNGALLSTVFTPEAVPCAAVNDKVKAMGMYGNLVSTHAEHKTNYPDSLAGLEDEDDVRRNAKADRDFFSHAQKISLMLRDPYSKKDQ